MGLAVGIDLGTTMSVVARLDERGDPIAVLNSDGQPLTPSAVWFSPDGARAGDEAKQRVALGDPNAVELFKRHMGEPGFVFAGGDQQLDATGLSAILLAHLKHEAEERLGAEITDAVITVPAYFKDAQRTATIEAGRLAGLNVLQTINEPTAAAFAFGFKRAPAGRTLLVYDLGGGTFDATLLRIENGEGLVLDSRGDHQLGGSDWDSRLALHLANEFRGEFGDDPLSDNISRAELLREAERIKKRLSALGDVSATVTHDGQTGRFTVTRTLFDGLTADLLGRTSSYVREMLATQHLAPSQVDGVLLVGGSTRMAMVRAFIEQEFGRAPLAGVNPDEAVALGAAIKAGERASGVSTARPAGGGLSRIIDVTNHSLGTIALNADGSAYLNRIILPKNRPVPCDGSEVFQQKTRSRGENTLDIYLTQGESTSPAAVSYLGRYVASEIPHQSGGPAQIEIAYRYSESGTVDVSARLVDTGQALPITVDALPADVPGRFSLPPAKPVRQPMTVYLAFDLSGSMSGPPLAEAKRAADGFVAKSDLKNCSIGVIAFSDTVRTTLKASHDKSQIKNALSALTMGQTGGGNAGHPFDETLGLLGNDDGPRFLVTLADGVWSNQPHAIERARACHAAGIDIVAIGFGGADQKFLRDIASTEEGSILTSQGGLVEAFSTIAQVLSEGGHGLSAGGGKTT